MPNFEEWFAAEARTFTRPVGNEPRVLEKIPGLSLIFSMDDKVAEAYHFLTELEVQPEQATEALQAVYDAALSLEENVEAALTWLSTDEIIPRKVVVCVREDLGMSAGKVAAQTGHAIHALCRDCPAGPALTAWEDEDGGSTIICLAVSDMTELIKVRDAATAAGISCFPIFDAGRTEVESGTCTVMAVGPATNEELDAITGKLRLYK